MKRTKQTKSSFTVLTNDPSLTAWGWAIIRSDDILDCGAIKTAPDPKKLRIRKGDSTIRRIKEINYALIEIIDEYDVSFILSELPHGSQSATAAVMIGVTAGIAQTISDCFDIVIEWYNEGDAKKCLLGKRSADKAEVIAKINESYNIKWKGVKWKDEAVADAMAIYHVACQQSETLKMMRL